MNEVFRRRLVGLAVLLVLLFLLSLVLPGTPAREELEPSTTVSLSGEVLQVSEADAVPPSDDFTASESPVPAARARPAAEAPQVEISDLSSPVAEAADSEQRPSPAPPKAAQATPVPAPKAPTARAAVESPAPPAPPAPAATAKPKSPTASESRPAGLDKPGATTWYVQIGSISEQGTASTIASLIRKQGYRGEVSRITGAKGKTLHRVRAGPYPSEVAARSAQARISTQGYPQARVVAEASH
jgi:cell division septation protein DedD